MGTPFRDSSRAAAVQRASNGLARAGNHSPAGLHRRQFESRAAVVELEHRCRFQAFCRVGVLSALDEASPVPALVSIGQPFAKLLAFDVVLHFSEMLDAENDAARMEEHAPTGPTQHCKTDCALVLLLGVGPAKVRSTAHTFARRLWVVDMRIE